MSANSRRTSPFENELDMERLEGRFAPKTPLTQLVRELKEAGMIVAGPVYHPDVIAHELVRKYTV